MDQFLGGFAVSGAILVSCFIIAALACFVLITALRAWRLSRLPIHSRLELYPVPKEGNHRAEYGGSYFEEVEWWKKPRAIDKVNETVDILKEMLFIRKLFQNQRSLWWASYTFHLGIYAMLAWTVLLGVSVFWSPPVIGWLATVAEIAGFALATTGTVLLLLRRALDRDLRKYTTPQEYFNLILILCVLLSGIYCWVAVTSPLQVATSVLHLGNQPFPLAVSLHLVLLGFMLIYIPLSKMSHYIGKFFSFHKVLWENDPNLPDSEVDGQMRSARKGPPQTTWAASHINPSANPKE
jgi:nitrate reductase gamma subunit